MTHSSWSSEAEEQAPWPSPTRRLMWEHPRSATRVLGMQRALDQRLESAGWRAGFTGLHKHLPAAASSAPQSLRSFEASALKQARCEESIT